MDGRFHPPDMATKSQSMRSVPPSARLISDALDGLTSMHAVDSGAVEITRPRLLCCFAGISGAATPRIDECRDLDTGVGEIECGAEGFVAPGEDDGTRAGRDADSD